MFVFSHTMQKDIVMITFFFFLYVIQTNMKTYRNILQKRRNSKFVVAIKKHLCKMGLISS